MSTNDEIVGQLKVSVEFIIPVHDLAHYDAQSLEEAAVNTHKWYTDGSANLTEDLAFGAHIKFTVTPVTD